MAKLYFKYGAMGSSKTAQCLMTKFNYEEMGRNVWFLKPATDTRDGVTTVKSRIGLSTEASVINTNENIYEAFMKKENRPDVIIVDECQFLTEEQVYSLRKISSLHDIPTLCFGLRTDFKCKLFPGSKALFELADSIAEIKSICKCGRKATVNARLDINGKIVTKGEQVELGTNGKYIGICWNCYYNWINNAN